MDKLTKRQFCYLANRYEEIKRTRKVLMERTHDEPANSFLKPWTKAKR